MSRNTIFSINLAVALAATLSLSSVALAQTSEMHHNHQAVPGTDTPPPAQDQNNSVETQPAQANEQQSEPRPWQQQYPSEFQTVPYSLPQPVPGYPKTYLMPAGKLLPTPGSDNQSQTPPLSGYVSKSVQGTTSTPQNSLTQQQAKPSTTYPLPSQQNQPQSNFPLLQQQAPGYSGYVLQPDYANPAPVDGPQQPGWYYGYPNQQYPYPGNSRRTTRTPGWNPLTIFRGGCF